jgi:hypothetical protein
LDVISVAAVTRWAVSSNEQAVANARAATTECSRRRLERAEVAQYLAEVSRSREVTAKAAATGR